MKVIFKYLVQHGTNQLQLPLESKIAHFDMQNGQMVVWVELDEHEPSVVHSFTVVGTGQLYDSWKKHLATCIDGPFVWHLLEG